MEQILLACGLHKEIDTAIMMLCKNMKAMVRSPNKDTEFFDIIAARTYISITFVYTLLRLRTSNVHRS